MLLAAPALRLHDALVALAFARGEEEELCRSLAPRIRLFAQRRMNDRAAVEDFVQETLLVVVQAVREGRVTADALPSFALGTCRSRMLDTHRTGQRRAAILEALPAPAPVTDPFADVVAVGKLLPKLDARMRRIVVETFFEGRQSAEIAARMALSEANVRVLRHRALGQLRDWMAA